MTWVSFMNYYLMRELGQEDSVVRNYHLVHPSWNDNHNYTYSACRRMGLEVRKGNWQWALDEVVARISAYGAVPDRHIVMIRLNEWFIWDRIRTQELRKWRIKPVSGYPSTEDENKPCQIAPAGLSSQGLEIL